MKKLLIFCICMFILPSCSIVGSEKYFAADTAIGTLQKNDDPGMLVFTGKPRIILYSKMDLKFKVRTSALGGKTYSFGPCVLIPIPVIPMFGLDNKVYNGPIEISFAIWAIELKDTYQLVKANIIVDNKVLFPKNIKIGYFDKNNKYAYENKFLPVLFHQKWDSFYLTYDVPRTTTDSFVLEFTVQDASDAVFLADKISFKQADSTYLQCAL